MDASREDNPRDIQYTSICSTGEVDLVTRERTSTERGIKSRHAQMIAICGTTGIGLFVGSGQALAIAGPGFLAHILMSAAFCGVVTTLTEVSIYLPVNGSSTAFLCYAICI